MIVGDTHGNTSWLFSYIFPVAMNLGVDAIVVVGDFGAWEHHPSGVLFFNDVNRLASKSGIPLYWLHGNHDKYSHTLTAYGDDQTADGFIQCRENLFYIPQGHAWTWAGKTLRSFGGAYSVDKGWRVEAEKERYAKLLREARTKASNNLFARDMVPSQTGTLWFPEEEMTDAEIEDLLHADFAEKDVVLSHDKPLSANPGWGRKSYPACVPNQLRLERALKVHKPRFWIHGHLHYHYNDSIGDGSSWRTEVVGLEPDNEAAESPHWRRENAWLLLELAGPEVDLKLGRTVKLNAGDIGEARARLGKVRTGL